VSKPKSKPPKAATIEIRTTYPFIVNRLVCLY
jgi:hypothetical protein